MAIKKSSKSAPAAQETEERTRRHREPSRPVVLKDPLVPHTHTAQKMKPYTGVVPSYVAAMDAHATRAGLTIRRLLKSHSPRYGDELLVVYSGTREQIVSCELVQRPDTVRCPTTKKASGFLPIKIVPTMYHPHGNVHLLADRLYALTVRVNLPREVTRAHAGVECFEFGGGDERWRYFSYCGAKEVLIAAGIAEADMFPNDGTEMEITQERTNGYGSDTLEESLRLHNGLWAYLKYPHTAREVEERARTESEKKLSDYKTPEEWLEHKEDWICRTVGIVCSPKFCSVDNKSGLRYTVDPAALDAIKNDIEAVAQLIRNIPVKVQSLAPKSTPAGRGKAAAAETDGKFQNFMKSVVNPHQRGDK